MVVGRRLEPITRSFNLCGLRRYLRTISGTQCPLWPGILGKRKQFEHVYIETLQYTLPNLDGRKLEIIGIVVVIVIGQPDVYTAIGCMRTIVNFVTWL